MCNQQTERKQCEGSSVKGKGRIVVLLLHLHTFTFVLSHRVFALLLLCCRTFSFALSNPRPKGEVGSGLNETPQVVYCNLRTSSSVHLKFLFNLQIIMMNHCNSNGKRRSCLIFYLSSSNKSYILQYSILYISEFSAPFIILLVSLLSNQIFNITIKKNRQTFFCMNKLI